jgi:hypothetical protein
VSWNYWKRAKKKKKKKKKKREAKGNKNKKKENRAHLEEENEGVSLVFHSRQAGVFRAAKKVQGSCQIKIFRSLAPLVCLLLPLPRTPPCYTFFWFVVVVDVVFVALYVVVLYRLFCAFNLSIVCVSLLSAWL